MFDVFAVDVTSASRSNKNKNWSSDGEKKQKNLPVVI